MLVINEFPNAAMRTLFVFEYELPDIRYVSEIYIE